MIIIGSLLIAGCGGPGLFLPDAQLEALRAGQSGDSRTVYFSRHYRVLDDERLSQTTHRVLRVGTNARTSPDILSTPDGSMERLQGFQARVSRRDGSSDSYSRSDLSSVNLSSSAMIAETSVKFLNVRTSLEAGDLVEIVTTHEMGLLPLGIRFSLDQAGDRSTNIHCSFEVRTGDTLQILVANDSLRPSITRHAATTVYSLSWPSFKGHESRFVLDRTNGTPIVFASVGQGRSPLTWVAFGDWYLQMINPKISLSGAHEEMARKITAGLSTPREKMDAIFNYCQKSVRYEQVYLSQGEFIPNEVTTIFNRKFGDCKDYSVLIYAMAKGVGLEPNLALCFRGRGRQFFGDITVSQFNHMIVHFQDGGDHLWYDGTNRTGLPGLTTDDLTNAIALVLTENNSHLVEISESPDNRLILNGRLRSDGNSLKGNLSIELRYQYAIEFFWTTFRLGEQETRDALLRWLRRDISEAMHVTSLEWRTDGHRFLIELDCEFENALTTIDSNTYVKPSRVFDSLLPDLVIDKMDQVFYYPYYGRISANVVLEGLGQPAGIASDGGVDRFAWRFACDLDPGPFDEEERADFVAHYTEAANAFRQTIKLRTTKEKP